MQLRRPLPMVLSLISLAVAMPAAAQGLTIINTDSEVAAAHNTTSTAPARAGRSAPPMPGASATVSAAPSARAMSPDAVDQPGSAGQRSSRSGWSQTEAYNIEDEWLSDAIASMAKKAGYDTTIWSVGSDGERDFALHSDLVLTAVNAKEALGDLVAPYPIRLCLFNVDRVAKVLAANERCQ